MTNSAQDISVVGGGNKTVELNTSFSFTQVTIKGRDTGTVVVTGRTLHESNAKEDFADSEFEEISAGAIDLSVIPRKRSFTLENKRLSGLRFTDGGSGSYTILIRQWNNVVS